MLNPNFWPAPIIGWLTNTAKNIDNLGKDLSIKNITEVLADTVWWKITQQVHTWVFK